MKKTLIWILGIVITLAAAYYQRMTGPTHPYRQKIEMNGQTYDLKLIRSHGGTSDAEIVLPFADTAVWAQLTYRHFPKGESYTTVDFQKKDNQLVAKLPNQPPAGKLEYFVYITDGSQEVELPHQIIRFKGDVPAFWLVPHVILMFLAMLLSNVTGMMVLFNSGNWVRLTIFTSILLLIGGLILGPIVQLHAFGDLWTGIPFGWDLTDNKTLIAAIFWGIALWQNHRSPSRFWTAIAVLVMLLVYAIPHSLFGSELDTETGRVIQGCIMRHF